MEKKNPWKTLTTKKVHETPWISVIHHDVINPSGKKGIYDIVHFKNLAIGIIPIDNEGNIYLVGQYRFPLKKYSWEIPEGGGDLNIPPIDSARRELLEETGIVAQNYQVILQMDLSNSATDEKAIIFLATDLSFHESSPEETEELSIRKIPFREAYDMTKRGEITDSLSLCAILKLQLLIQEKEFKNKNIEI